MTVNVVIFTSRALLIDCLEEYLKIHNKAENQKSETICEGCKSVLHSKSKDESLVCPF